MERRTALDSCGRVRLVSDHMNNTCEGLDLERGPEIRGQYRNRPNNLSHDQLRPE